MPLIRRKKGHRFIRLTDIFLLATTSLRSNKLRSSLTIMGVTIGVLSVVGTMTALSAMRSSINNGMAVFSSNMLNIDRYPAIMVASDGWWNYQHRKEISYDQAQRFKRLMADKGVRVSIQEGINDVRVLFLDKRTSPVVEVVGGNEYTIDAFTFNLDIGRGIGVDDVLLNRSVTVLGADVSKALFSDRNPLGQQVIVCGHRYAVIGVMQRKGDFFGKNIDNLIFIPVTRFISDYGRDRRVRLQVLAPSVEVMPQVFDMTIGAMRLVRGLDPEDPDDFSIDSNESLQSAFDEIARIIGSVGLVISMIALIAAGVGVMNIMLVSVTERTREIGIRKSLGARSTDVLRQFLLESVFLSELGALMGILLGIVIGNAVAGLMNVEPVFPMFWAVIAVIVCSLIGIGFGMYPAWKASRLDPVEALRFE